MSVTTFRYDKRKSLTNDFPLRSKKIGIAQTHVFLGRYNRETSGMTNVVYVDIHNH